MCCTMYRFIHLSAFFNIFFISSKAVCLLLGTPATPHKAGRLKFVSLRSTTQVNFVTFDRKNIHEYDNMFEKCAHLLLQQMLRPCLSNPFDVNGVSCWLGITVLFNKGDQPQNESTYALCSQNKNLPRSATREAQASPKRKTVFARHGTWRCEALEQRNKQEAWKGQKRSNKG